MTVEVLVDGGLQIAAEHARRIAGRVEDGYPLCKLTWRVPVAHECQDADREGRLQHADDEPQSEHVLNFLHGRETERADRPE